MPSLIRFLAFIAIVAGIAYGAMFAVTLFVKPEIRTMRERIPQSQINPVPIDVPLPTQGDKTPDTEVDATGEDTSGAIPEDKGEN